MITHCMACACGRVTGVTKKNMLYQHRRPDGHHCSFSGVTPYDMAHKITHLARRLLDSGLVKNPETGEWERMTE